MRETWFALVVLFALTVPCAGPSLAGNEESICSRPEVIFCENFEDRPAGPSSGLAGSTGPKNPGWEFSPDPHLTISGTESAAGGSKSLLHTYPAVNPADNGGNGYTHALTNWQLRELYIRWYVKFSSNFKFSPAGQKELYGYENFLWNTYGGENYLWLQGIDNNYGPNVNREAARLTTGVWHCIEGRVKLSSGGATAVTGNLDAEFDMWTDDVLTHSHRNIKVGNPASVAGNDWKQVGIMSSSYYNCLNSWCPSDSANNHPEQYRWHDNFVVSTARIGCIGTPASPPAAPTSVKAQ